jgi:hypothetical protein
MTEIVECPHCFTRVVPSLNGECPACGQNTRDETGTDPRRTVLILKHAQELPPFCCHCACRTDSWVKVLRALSHRNDNPEPVLPVLFGGVLSLLFRDRSRTEDFVVVNVPQCRDCKKNGAPQSVATSPVNQTVSILVDKRFRDIVEHGFGTTDLPSTMDSNPYYPPRTL